MFLLEKQNGDNGAHISASVTKCRGNVTAEVKFAAADVVYGGSSLLPSCSRKNVFWSPEVLQPSAGAPVCSACVCLFLCSPGINYRGHMPGSYISLRANVLRQSAVLITAHTISLIWVCGVSCVVRLESRDIGTTPTPQEAGFHVIIQLM